MPLVPGSSPPNAYAIHPSIPPPHALILERPTTTGGPPPPLQTKVTKWKKSEIYNRGNLIAPFLVHKFWGSSPPPPPLFSFLAWLKQNLWHPPPPKKTLSQIPGRVGLASHHPPSTPSHNEAHAWLWGGCGRPLAIRPEGPVEGSGVSGPAPRATRLCTTSSNARAKTTEGRVKWHGTPQGLRSGMRLGLGRGCWGGHAAQLCWGADGVGGGFIGCSDTLREQCPCQYSTGCGFRL